jgi:hypothetical protein
VFSAAFSDFVWFASTSPGIGQRINPRNTDAKAINPQNAEINDWRKTVAAWCQRMSKSELTLVEAMTKRPSRG